MTLVPIKITEIPIHPSTNVRSTQNDRWLFSDTITDEYLKELDRRREETHGKPGSLAARRRQLEKYNAYKQELRDWAHRNQFVMPMGYMCISFYVPFPKSWRWGKRKKMAYQPHVTTPDADNFIKALFDGIMPRKNRVAGQQGSDDRKIHCYTMFKVWVPEGEEKIVIAEYDSIQFSAVFAATLPTQKNT